MADRFSQLPNDALHNILSFLSTKEAVQTRVLSKRWRWIWASLSVLRFDTSEFRSSEIEKFKHFVNFVLLLRDKSNLMFFSLFSETKLDPFHKITWVLYAVKHRVQYMEIILYYEDELPHCLLNCQSLQYLDLHVRSLNLQPLSTIFLGDLRTLILVGITFIGDSLGKLISGCPVLKELIVESCTFEMLDIWSHMLRILGIRSSGFSSSRITKVRLLAPGLQFLHFDSLDKLDCSLSKLSSLRSLVIHTSKVEESARILGGVCNVQEVDLSPQTIEHLFEEITSLEVLPTFCNLKLMQLRTSTNAESLDAVKCLLHCSPNLEELVIEFDESFSQHRIHAKQFKAASFMEHLRSVEIQHFKSSLTANSFVNFLLNHAKALKRFFILSD